MDRLSAIMRLMGGGPQSQQQLQYKPNRNMFSSAKSNNVPPWDRPMPEHNYRDVDPGFHLDMPDNGIPMPDVNPGPFGDHVPMPEDFSTPYGSEGPLMQNMLFRSEHGVRNQMDEAGLSQSAIEALIRRLQGLGQG